MTTPETLAFNPRSVSFGNRQAVHLASGLAAMLATRRPATIRKVLERLRRGARPASRASTERIRDQVLAVSLPCAGRERCVRLSLTVMLLARVRGIAPTWCVGVRRIPPFAAHAWVECAGEPVGENLPEDYLRKLIVVSPASR